jgi:PREDICTED: myelin transcription factor 1
MAIRKKNKEDWGKQSILENRRTPSLPRSNRNRSTINESERAFRKYYESVEIEDVDNYEDEAPVAEPVKQPYQSPSARGFAFVNPTEQLFNKMTASLAGAVQRIQAQGNQNPQLAQIINSGKAALASADEDIVASTLENDFAGIIESSSEFPLEAWLRYSFVLIGGDKEQGAFSAVPFIFVKDNERENDQNTNVRVEIITPNRGVFAEELDYDVVSGNTDKELEDFFVEMFEQLVPASAIGIHEATSTNCGLHGNRRYEGKMLRNMSTKDLREAISEEKRKVKDLRKERRMVDESDKKKCRSCDKEIAKKTEVIEMLEERLDYLKKEKKASAKNESAQPRKVYEAEEVEDEDDDKKEDEKEEGEEKTEEPEAEGEGDEDAYEDKFVRLPVNNVDKGIDVLVKYEIPKDEITIVDREEGDEGDSGTLLVPLSYKENLDRMCLDLYGKTLEEITGTKIEEEGSGESIADDDLLSDDDFDFDFGDEEESEPKEESKKK